MLKFLKKITKSTNVNSPRYKRQKAAQLDGRHIRYVTERIAADSPDGGGEDTIEEIIGREGFLNARNGELIVHASGKTLFRANIEQMEAWDLLSLDGVVLTAPDLENGGVVRTVIAYYKYYR